MNSSTSPDIGRARPVFGPILFYDLIRLARRGRYFLVRCCYASLLFLILYVVYFQFMESLVSRLQNQIPAGPAARATEMAEFAEWFFYTFMVVQFGCVFLLTPAYTAGAISEEKERKTLDFLLATDLVNREIVLSKLAARLANMSLILVTGLPILSLTQFLGGVDPNLVLAGFLATVLTMLSVGSFSILCSVYVKKARDAILLSYLGIGAYLALASYLYSDPSLAGPATFYINWGNLYAVLSDLHEDVKLGKDLAAIIPDKLYAYAIFHITIALLCAVWAVRRLRVVALREVRHRPEARARRWRRPRLGRLPMIWKEIFIEPGLRLNWLGWAIVGPLIVLSMIPAAILVGQFFLEAMVNMASAQVLADDVMEWMQIIGTGVACLLLVGVAVRASSSVTSERERDTLDGLLTSPLESHDILFAKWLGSLLSVRWGWLWLGAIWGVGLTTQGLSPHALPFLVIAWLVYAGTLAGVGLWYSTSSKTTLRATFMTLFVTAAVLAGPWLMWLFCLPFCGGDMYYLTAMFSPTMVIAWLSTTEQEFMANEVRNLFALFGVFLWTFAAVGLWSMTRRRFRKISSRMPYHRPDDLPPSTSEFKLRYGEE